MAEWDDAITDFRDRSDNHDRILIEASAIRGGLGAGGHIARDRYQIGDGHKAEDRDTRFIFDTTDRTLWFDENGDRAGGLQRVADLLAGAEVAHNDIWLI